MPDGEVPRATVWVRDNATHAGDRVLISREGLVKRRLNRLGGEGLKKEEKSSVRY